MYESEKAQIFDKTIAKGMSVRDIGIGHWKIN